MVIVTMPRRSVVVLFTATSVAFTALDRFTKKRSLGSFLLSLRRRGCRDCRRRAHGAEDGQGDAEDERVAPTNAAERERHVRSLFRVPAPA